MMKASVATPIGVGLVIAGILLTPTVFPAARVIGVLSFLTGLLVLVLWQPRGWSRSGQKIGIGARKEQWINGDLLTLRRLASLKMIPRGAIDPQDYSELRHAVDHIVEDPETGQQFVWDASEVLVTRDVLDRLSRVLVGELEKKKWDFDTICAMSNTGKSIAVLLRDVWPEPSKGLLTVDSENGRFFPRLPQAGEKILLVDSTVQTGNHLHDVTSKIASQQATAVGAVVFCLHDRLPSGKEKRPIVEAWLHDKKLLYIFKISELYEEWRKSQAEG